MAQWFRHALVAFQMAAARVTLSDRDRVERYVIVNIAGPRQNATHAPRSFRRWHGQA